LFGRRIKVLKGELPDDFGGFPYGGHML